jgi:hypothetical protein
MKLVGDKKSFTVFFLALVFSAAGCAHRAMQEKEAAHRNLNPQQTALQTQQLEDLARQAYSFGFPLVLTKTASEASNSKNWFDLSQGPVTISAPAAGHRYYLGTVFDAWSNVIGVIGTGTTKNKKANFVLVGPQWKGELPTNTQVIESPTAMAWLSLRIYNDGTAKDMAAARQLRSGLRIAQTGNSDELMNRMLAGSETVGAGSLKSMAADRVFNMSADIYYHELCALMLQNPPRETDADLLAKFQALGLQPTADFDLSKLSPDVQAALVASVENARDYILGHPGDLAPSEPINGWTVYKNAADFGVDYDRRAYVAATALGTPRAEDEMIYNLTYDNLGQKLSDEGHYQITFSKGFYPPARAWSLFAEGSPTRAISGTRPLRKNSDGSVTIYIQKNNPGKFLRANWLPSPQGDFNVSLRLYEPKADALSLKWEPPTVEHVIEPSPLVMEQSILTLNRAP